MIARDGDRGNASEPLAGRRFSLGDIAVDPVRHTVSQGGRVRAVEPRVMELLVYLSGRPGEIVSKRELIETVWRSHVVDEAVHRAVSLLRAALGDSAQRPAVIETVPRHGYRLLVPPTPANAGKTSRLTLPFAAAAAVAGLIIVLPGDDRRGAPEPPSSPPASERVAAPVASRPAAKAAGDSKSAKRPRLAANRTEGSPRREPKTVTPARQAVQSPVAYAPRAPSPRAPGDEAATPAPRRAEAPRAEQPTPTPALN